MSLVEQFEQKVNRFIPTELVTDLELQERIETTVRNAGGTKVFDSTDGLLVQLRKHGVDEIDALALCALSKVDGFKAVITENNPVKQASIDLLVRNAIEQTGMTRSTVLRLVSALAGAFGVTVLTSAVDLHEAIEQISDGQETAFVVPESLYREELNHIDGAIKTALKRKDQADKNRAKNEENRKQQEQNDSDSAEPAPPLPVPDFTINESTRRTLEALVKLGVPKAKYYMGLIFVKGLAKGGDETIGIELLEDAAAAGDSDAAKELADYHYGNGPDEWQEAYGYYTGYGSLALDTVQQNKMINILNHGVYNRRLLIFSSAILAVMLLVLILVPGAAPYAAHRVVGAIALIFSVAVLGAGFLLYRNNPYTSLYSIPAAMFVPWVIYIAVRLLA